MSPAVIISTISGLLPRIKAAGNAEAILLDYARTENLAPAQLLKLAQTMNTARQLTWMDQNPEARGATIPLIDGANLCAKYAAFAGPQVAVKRASHAVVIADEARVPDFFKLASAGGTFVKQAEAVVTAPPMSAHEAKLLAMDKRSCAERDIETIEVLREDYLEKYAHAREQLSRALITSGDNLATIEEDVRVLGAPGDYEALTAAVKYAAKFRPPIATLFADLAATKRATKRMLLVDRCGILPLVKAATAQRALILACDAVKKSYFDTEIPVVNLPADAGGQAPQPQRNNERRGSQRNNERRGSRGSDPSYNSSQGTGEAASRDFIDDALAPRRGASPAAAGKSKGGETDFIKEVADAITEMRPKPGASGRVMESLMGKGNSETGIIPAALRGMKHAPGIRQKGIDEAIRDVSTAATLQKLLMTDEVISEADPAQVADLYNDLRQADPSISHNPNRLRFALREALQYGGITQQSFKTLAETDRNMMQAAKDRMGIQQQLYAGQ